MQPIRVDEMCFRMFLCMKATEWPLVSLNQHEGNVLRRATHIDTQHLLRRQKCTDWGYRSTGKIAQKFRKFL